MFLKNIFFYLIHFNEVYVTFQWTLIKSKKWFSSIIIRILLYIHDTFFFFVSLQGVSSLNLLDKSVHRSTFPDLKINFLNKEFKITEAIFFIQVLNEHVWKERRKKNSNFFFCYFFPTKQGDKMVSYPFIILIVISIVHFDQKSPT